VSISEGFLYAVYYNRWGHIISIHLCIAKMYHKRPGL